MYIWGTILLWPVKYSLYCALESDRDKAQSSCFTTAAENNVWNHKEQFQCKNYVFLEIMSGWEVILLKFHTPSDWEET